MIFIVVEDLDRSGDAGRYFLETLRQFIRNNLPDKIIVVIVPIGTEIWERNKDHQETYHKVLDYVLFFQPKSIKYDTFIDKIINPEAFPQAMPFLWKYHLEVLLRIASSNHLTIREIKSALRSAGLIYKDLYKKGFNPDPRVVTALCFMNYIMRDGKNRWALHLRKNDSIDSGNPFHNFLLIVGNNVTEENFSRGMIVSASIRWSSDKKHTLPTYFEDFYNEKKNGYLLSDFYLLPFGEV